MDERGCGGPVGAVFVLSTPTAGARGPVAAWISTAGWASATRRVLGQAWITTPSGVHDPDEARTRGSVPVGAGGVGELPRALVPTVVKTLARDVRRWQVGRRFAVDADGPWRDTPVRFVWQRHELFQTAGVDLARRLGVPSVLFVPATVVWEASRWSVHRPGWSRLAERLGEVEALRAADAVACGSEVVAEQARRLGARPERVLVTPTGVDLDLFATAPDRCEARRRLGLEGRFVVGWTGSFRTFHAVEIAVRAMARVPDAVLLLVGDGPERRRVEDLARRDGVEVRTTGTVPHADVPAHLAAMDVGLVAASPGDNFHYSPLKLAEYLAAGLPVVAPAAPGLRARLEGGVDALLVPPGDEAGLADAIRRLRDDEGLRARLGAAARAAAPRWSWDHQVRRVLDALP